MKIRQLLYDLTLLNTYASNLFLIRTVANTLRSQHLLVLELMSAFI